MHYPFGLQNWKSAFKVSSITARQLTKSSHRWLFSHGDGATSTWLLEVLATCTLGCLSAGGSLSTFCVISLSLTTKLAAEVHERSHNFKKCARSVHSQHQGLDNFNCLYFMLWIFSPHENTSFADCMWCFTFIRDDFWRNLQILLMVLVFVSLSWTFQFNSVCIVEKKIRTLKTWQNESRP